MLHFKLPTNEYAIIVEEPIVILHGENDAVIPYSNAAKLKPLLKEKDIFITLPGTGHLDVGSQAVYIQAMDSILVL